nr:glycosyltransferase family A protein [Nitriliruptor alkaliphilus]
MSVVLIFHDDEHFLPEAIESVFAQTYTDWELILADDGSRDGSTAIARRWAEQEPTRITYVEHASHANRGPPATRNLGFRSARGRYIAVLDSDDVWEPDKLEEQVAILETHPDVGMLFGTSLYWWSWPGEASPVADRFMPIGAPKDRVHQPPDLAWLLYPLGKGVAPCPSSWLIRRELIERIGGWEEHIRPVFEDQGFLAKAYLETPIWVSSKCWDRYRRHAGQIVTTTSTQGLDDARREFLSWYEGYLRARDVRDRRIWAAVQRAWWPLHHPRLAAARRGAGRVRARVRRRLTSRGSG